MERSIRTKFIKFYTECSISLASLTNNARQLKKVNFSEPIFHLENDNLMSILSDQFCGFNFSKTCNKFRIREKVSLVSDSTLIFDAEKDGVFDFCVKLVGILKIGRLLFLNYFLMFETMLCSIFVHNWWFVCYCSETACFVMAQSKPEVVNHWCASNLLCWKRWRSLFF